MKDDKKPGPDPERVKIEKRDWKKAVEKALEKKKPDRGWPDRGDTRESGGPG